MTRGILVAGLALFVLLAAPAVAAVIGGTDGPDRVVGGPQRDVLRGLGGSDTLIGRGKGDTLRAADGGDTLRPGPGEDILQGGKGSDVLKARDGELDRLFCGAGADTAIVDELEDGVYDCEEVIEPT
jgi:Ca2+-binding RTX toxin-like protein